MKLARTIITPGLISLNFLFAIFPIQAQGNKQSSKCAATLQSVKKKITQGRQIKILKVSKVDISKDYQSYPQHRPFRYAFVLRGESTETFLSSGKILKSLSKEIITNCNDISQVVFGPELSDNYESYGLISANRIEALKCVYPGSSPKMPWGYTGCL